MREMLSYLSFGLGILLLVVNFFLNHFEGRERKREADTLRATLDDLGAENRRRFDELREKINELVAQGRVSKDDAGRLLQIFVHEQVGLSEAIGVEVKSPSQPEPKE